VGGTLPANGAPKIGNLVQITSFTGFYSYSTGIFLCSEETIFMSRPEKIP
jgi:hypothetical protein